MNKINYDDYYNDYEKYLIEGYSKFSYIDKLESISSWAISSDIGSGNKDFKYLDHNRFTSSDEFKSGKGDFFFSSDGFKGKYVKFQIFKGNDKIHKESLLNNVIIDVTTAESSVNYIINAVLNPDNSIERLAIINIDKLKSMDNIEAAYFIDKPLYISESHSIKVPAFFRSSTGKSYAIYPIVNVDPEFSMGKHILQAVITYKQGYQLNANSGKENI